MCAHPYHSPERVSSALVMLDSIIRSLALTSIDADEPSVSVFTPRAVPSVPVASHARVRRQEGCSCHSLTLGQISRSSHEHTPLWVATAAWNPDWTLAEIRKEESRRLCWSALSLAAGHTSHAAAFSSPALDYFCIQPANVRNYVGKEYVCRLTKFLLFSTHCYSRGRLYSNRLRSMQRIRPRSPFGRCTLGQCCCGIVVCVCEGTT